MGSGAFTLAETGLIAQMKLSCLIVFGEGRSILEIAFRWLEQQENFRETFECRGLAFFSGTGGGRAAGETEDEDGLGRGVC